MAGGPILPSSIYLGGASGNLSPTFYIPATQTTANQGALEGIGVVASLGSDAQAVLQFNLPETGAIPSGTLKLRLLAMANATTGNAIISVKDGGTSANSSLGTGTLATDAANQVIGWTTADILVETKITLTGTATVNQVFTVLLTFNTASWTLAQPSVWQASLVWE